MAFLVRDHAGDVFAFGAEEDRIAVERVEELLVETKIGPAGPLDFARHSSFRYKIR